MRQRRAVTEGGQAAAYAVGGEVLHLTVVVVQAGELPSLGHHEVETARSRASMLHDATTPRPAADAKSRPPDSQPTRIEEAERAVGAPVRLRRGPGRGLVPALDQVGEGVKARGVRGRAVAGVVSCRVPGHAECPVTGRC